MRIRLLLPVALLAVVTAACGADRATDSTDTRAAATTQAPGATSTAPPATGPTTTVAPATTLGAETTTTSSEPRNIVIAVAGGEVSGPGRVDVDLGSDVALLVTADVEDEVHLHTYDLFAAVAPGRDALIDFIADIPGIIEVELEGSGLLLVELEVR